MWLSALNSWVPRTAGIHPLEIRVCQGFLFWFCCFLSDRGGGSDGVPLHQEKPLVLNSTSCCLVQRHLLSSPCRAHWTVGGAGEAAREGVRGRGPVVFPVICRKETKWEVECAGCQWAGCSATLPASSSLAPSLGAASSEGLSCSAAGPVSVLHGMLYRV